jgi:lipoyl(octanoyl) transferase
MKCLWMGRLDYVSAVQMQERLVDRGSLIGLITPAQFDSPSESIIGLEHPLTISLGKRADPLRDIVVPMKRLKELNVAVVGSDRGGQTTLHSPGQLVIYPVVHLKARQMKVRDYVYLLEEVTQRFLADFGIVAHFRGDEPGLHTNDGKIAFFGLRIQKGMSSHGLSINVNNDLSEFAMIRSCGVTGEKFAKMSDYNAPTDLEALFHRWCSYFQTALNLTQDVNRPMLESSSGFRE